MFHLQLKIIQLGLKKMGIILLQKMIFHIQLICSRIIVATSDVIESVYVYAQHNNFFPVYSGESEPAIREDILQFTQNKIEIVNLPH